MNRYVIVGNGVAGVRAAAAILRRDPEAQVDALTDEVHPFYLRPQLPTYVAGRVGEDALRGRTTEPLDERRFNLRLGVRATAVETDQHLVRLSGGETLGYDRLVIATGAVPQRLGMANEDARGVVRLKTLEDARRVRLLAQEARRVVVVGSGIFGLELLDGLAGRGLKATYLVSEERFWPEALDPTASRLAAADLRAAGVDLRFDSRLDEIRVRSGEVVAAVDATGELFECQILGIGVGYAPAVDFLAASGIETDRGILVDERLSTSAPDVYAAGDAAQLRQPLPGTSGISVRWHNAWQQGHVAGGNAAGLAVPFPATVTTTSTRLFGRDFAVLGEGHAPAGDGLTEVTGPYPRAGIYKRLVSREGRLTGALLYGDVHEATELIGYVRDGTPTADLPRALMDRLFGTEGAGGAVRGVVCPSCKLELPLPAGAGHGDLLTCAACGIEMRLQRRGGRLVGVAV